VIVVWKVAATAVADEVLAVGVAVAEEVHAVDRAAAGRAGALDVQLDRAEEAAVLRRHHGGGRGREVAKASQRARRPETARMVGFLGCAPGVGPYAHPRTEQRALSGVRGAIRASAVVRSARATSTSATAVSGGFPFARKRATA
jgi:hypothetical protein